MCHCFKSPMLRDQASGISAAVHSIFIHFVFVLLRRFSRASDGGNSRALEWVLSRALLEKLDFRTSFATRLLMAVLQNFIALSSVPSLPSGFQSMASDVSSVATQWKAWIEGVQGNASEVSCCYLFVELCAY